MAREKEFKLSDWLKKIVDLACCLVIICLLYRFVDIYKRSIILKNGRVVTMGVDSSVDPCDDFYQFACGSLKGSDDWRAELNEKIQKQLTSALKKDIDVNDIEPMKFTKYLYQTCLKISTIKEQSLDPLLDIMEQVGGWPVLKENKTWNETAFNWSRVIFKFGNASYWDNIFVPMQPRKNSTQFNIMVGKPMLEIPQNVLKDINNEIVQKHFKSMVDIAVRMGASRSYATKELNETLHFEIKLTNITSKNNSNSNLLKKQVTTSELMKNYSFIPWDEYIKHQLPSNVTIADVDDKIIVYDLSYINDLKYLIESTPKRVVANFVVWKQFDFLTDILNLSARGSNVDERESECLESILTKMSSVLSIMYVREYFDKNTKNDVSIILNNVQDEFVGLLKNASWMDEITKNRSIDKAMSMHHIIGYPQELLNDSKTDKYFRYLESINNNFFVNVYIVRRNAEKTLWILFDPRTSIEEERWLHYVASPLGFSAFYDLMNNALVVPAATLQHPHYSDDFPLYMKYGRVGFTFGHEIAHGFGVSGRKFDKYSNIVDWPNETDTTYDAKAQCILEQYSTYSEESAAKMSHDDDIADNSGIRAAYYAYKKLAHMDTSEKISGKIYSPQQMFWISYANDWCGNGAKGDTEHSPHRYRVIGAVSNMKEFANDFNCPKNSKMNPSKKCQVW